MVNNKGETMNNIILMDRDSDFEPVLGIIRTDRPTEEIESIFDSVKDKLPGEWQIDDLLEGLNENGIDFTYESFNALYI